ncbi:uncharacterized protein ACBT44_007429 isoform 1-T1 [Syngnathus typhle]
MTYESKRCTLKTLDGKYITALKHRDGIKLCVIDKQGTKNLQVELLEDSDKKHVAFLFWHDGSCYSLTVDASSLKLLKSNHIPPPPTSCLFVKKPSGAGGLYLLESVLEPNWYLSIESINRGQPSLLILGSSGTALLLKDI